MKFAFIFAAAFCSIISAAQAQSSISDNIAQTLTQGHIKKVAANNNQDQLVEVKPETKKTEEKEIISGDSLLDRVEKNHEDTANSSPKQNEIIKEKTVKKEIKKVTQYHIKKGEQGVKATDEKPIKSSAKTAKKKIKKENKKSKVAKAKKTTKSKASHNSVTNSKNVISKTQRIES